MSKGLRDRRSDIQVVKAIQHLHHVVGAVAESAVVGCLLEMGYPIFPTGQHAYALTQWQDPWVLVGQGGNRCGKH